MDWEQIWRDHWKEIYSFIFYRVQNRQEAEELTQETFLKALRSPVLRQAKIQSIPALLKTVARNLIIDNWRHQKRSIPVQIFDHNVVVKSSEKGPEEMFLLVEQSEELKQILKGLSPDQQQVIQYRLIEQLSIKETAERMNKPEGTIKTLQYRAIQAVRDRINFSEGGTSLESESV